MKSSAVSTPALLAMPMLAVTFRSSDHGPNCGREPSTSWRMRSAIWGAAYFRAGSRHENRELVPPESRADVEQPSRSTQHVADRAEHRVAAEMTEVVVHLLEVVDVD